MAVNSNIKFKSIKPIAQGVLVKGIPEQNEVLKVVYQYHSEYDVLEGATIFKWYRGSSLIAGANAQTYTVVDADRGQTIKAEVTVVDETGLIGVAVQSPTVLIDSTAFGAELITNGKVWQDDNEDGTPQDCTKGSNATLLVLPPDQFFDTPYLRITATNTTSKFVSVQNPSDSVPMKVGSSYRIRVWHQNSAAGILKASGSGVFGGGNKTLPIAAGKANCIFYDGAITTADCRPQIEPNTTNDIVNFAMSVKQLV